MKGLKLPNRSPLSLTIPNRGYEEIGRIARHAAQLSDVLSAAAKVAVNSPASVMNEKVAEATGIPSDEVALLLSGISSLRALMEDSDVSANELVAAVTATIESDATEGWLEQYLKLWEAGSPSVSAALASIPEEHPISVRQKARKLTYAHQNIFKSSRIITDLRPVFSTNGDQVEAVVLTHVLSVKYFDGVRSQQIEFALDANDIAELRKSAERAQVKTQTTRKLFDQSEWLLIVAGDSADASEG